MKRMGFSLWVLLLSGCASLGPLSPLGPLERSLIYYPAAYPHGNWQPGEIPFEDARFQAEDGTRLNGWYLHHDNPRGVVLFCHGNARNITGRARELAILNQQHQLAILMLDYRGYGKSAGRPTENGVLQDA